MTINKGLDEKLCNQMDVLRNLKHEDLWESNQGRYSISELLEEFHGKPVHATYMPQAGAAEFRVWVGATPFPTTWGHADSFWNEKSGSNLALSVKGKPNLVKMIRDSLVKYWPHTPTKYDGTLYAYPADPKVEDDPCHLFELSELMPFE